MLAHRQLVTGRQAGRLRRGRQGAAETQRSALTCGRAGRGGGSSTVGAIKAEHPRAGGRLCCCRHCRRCSRKSSRRRCLSSLLCCWTCIHCSGSSSGGRRPALHRCCATLQQLKLSVCTGHAAGAGGKHAQGDVGGTKAGRQAGSAGLSKNQGASLSATCGLATPICNMHAAPSSLPQSAAYHINSAPCATPVRLFRWPITLVYVCGCCRASAAGYSGAITAAAASSCPSSSRLRAACSSLAMTHT